MHSHGHPGNRRRYGGLPRGGLTEIVGPAASGRTSLLHSILAGATVREEFCALVDVEDAFSLHDAADAGRAEWDADGGESQLSIATKPAR